MSKVPRCEALLCTAEFCLDDHGPFPLKLSVFMMMRVLAVTKYTDPCSIIYSCCAFHQVHAIRMTGSVLFAQ